MANLVPNQHATMLGAKYGIAGRKASDYKQSPLLGYAPRVFHTVPSYTIFNVSFETGVPIDSGPHVYTITENGNPQFAPNSPFNGLSTDVPTGSSDITYILSDSKFQRAFPFTIETWVFLSEAGSSLQRIVSAQGAGSVNYRLYVNASGYLEFAVYISGGWVTITSTILAKVGSWFYTAGIYEGQNIKLFDGPTEYTAAQSGRVVTGAGAVMFGANAGEDPPTTFNNPLRGYLHSCQLLSRGRTKAEIERYLYGV